MDAQWFRNLTWADLADGPNLANFDADHRAAVVELLEPTLFPEAFAVPDLDLFIDNLVALAAENPGEPHVYTLYRFENGSEPSRNVVIFGREDRLLSLADVAGILGCSPRTVRRILDNPDNPLVAIRTHRRELAILDSVLSEYLEAALQAAKAEAAENRRAASQPQVDAVPDLPNVLPAPRRRRRKNGGQP